MSGILAVLDCNEILSADFAARLREYVSFKNPCSSPEVKAGVFADAVNRVVAYNAPSFGTELGERLRELLYPSVAKKKVFSIYCSDMFKASLGMKTLGYLFFRGLNAWLSSILHGTVDRESLFNFVLNVHKQMESYPGMDVSEIINYVENEYGGLRFETGGIACETSTEQGDNDRIPVLSPAPFAETCIVGSIEADDSGAEDRRFPLLEFPSRVKAVSGLAAAVLALFFAVSPIAVDMRTEQKGTFPENSPVTDMVQLPGGSPVFDWIDSSLPATGTGEASTLDNAPASPAGIKMRATAYDLSYESCGKMPWDPGYGITFSGTRAAAGRTIAVDPDVIPLGSRVYITFPEQYSSMDGVYLAEDTGRLVKGRTVDIFFGEDKAGSSKINRKAMEFGVRYVNIKVLD